VNLRKDHYQTISNEILETPTLTWPDGSVPCWPITVQKAHCCYGSRASRRLVNGASLGRSCILGSGGMRKAPSTSFAQLPMRVATFLSTVVTFLTLSLRRTRPGSCWRSASKPASLHVGMSKCLSYNYRWWITRLVCR
jgi:hypothetical protein